ADDAPADCAHCFLLPLPPGEGWGEGSMFELFCRSRKLLEVPALTLTLSRRERGPEDFSIHQATPRVIPSGNATGSPPPGTPAIAGPRTHPARSPTRDTPAGSAARPRAAAQPQAIWHRRSTPRNLSSAGPFPPPVPCSPTCRLRSRRPRARL